jgi:predicted RNA methylase
MSTPKDDLAREIKAAQQVRREFSEFAYDDGLASDEVEEGETFPQVGVDPAKVAHYLRALGETLTKIEKAFRELS